MRKLNTLNEEINRMKSLFGESRLYGNLVTEDTEPSPDKVKEVMEPIKKDTLKILSLWKSYNNGLSEISIRAMKKTKGKVEEEIKKAESIISGMDSKDFCSDATLSKIERKRRELEEVENNYHNILTDKDKGFISRLKGKMNLLKDECKRLKTETITEEVIDGGVDTETNTEEVIDSEEETETNTENTNDCGNNNDKMCDMAIKIDESVEGGVLDLVEMIGGTMTGPSMWTKPGGCRTPMELSEKTRNSTKEIVLFDDDYYEEPYTGGIDLCGNSLFSNVTKIHCLEISHGDEIKNMFPNLKTIDLLIVNKKGKILDMLPDGVLINDFYFGEENFWIVDDFIKINKQMKKIPLEFLSYDFVSYLVDQMGWEGKEFDGDDYIVNPNNPKIRYKI